MKTISRQFGFTLVELIVTIVITGIFIGAITQSSASVLNLAIRAHRFEMASNLAYNNMRIYANGQKATDFGFNCNGDVGTDVAPFNDAAIHSDATGTVLINTTSAGSINDLPGPVVQSVTAVAPYGCGNTVINTSIGPVVRILSTVTYGTPAQKVVHATYVSLY